MFASEGAFEDIFTPEIIDSVYRDIGIEDAHTLSSLVDVGNWPHKKVADLIEKYLPVKS